MGCFVLSSWEYVSILASAETPLLHRSSSTMSELYRMPGKSCTVTTMGEGVERTETKAFIGTIEYMLGSTCAVY